MILERWRLTVGRPLLDLSRPARSAKMDARPPLHTDFLVETALQPGVLMIWDFCQSFRCGQMPCQASATERLRCLLPLLS